MQSRWLGMMLRANFALHGFVELLSIADLLSLVPKMISSLAPEPHIHIYSHLHDVAQEAVGS